MYYLLVSFGWRCLLVVGLCVLLVVGWMLFVVFGVLYYVCCCLLFVDCCLCVVDCLLFLLVAMLFDCWLLFVVRGVCDLSVVVVNCSLFLVCC